MKEKNQSVKIVMLLIALVAVLGLVAFMIDRVRPGSDRMDLAAYYGLNGEDEVAIITDDGISETNGRIIDDTVYLPYKTVSEEISGSIYYDSESATVIITTPTEKQRLDAAGVIRTEDDTVYVSYDLVQTYSNASLTRYDDPARIVAYSDRSFLSDKVAEDTAVRYRADIKSKILTELSSGETVRVIEQDETDRVEGWTMVQSDDGLRGYVDNECLDGNAETADAEYEDRLGEYTHLLHDGPVNMLYHQVTSRTDGKVLQQSLDGVKGVNVIAPTWFFLDSAGGEQRQIADASYVETAHSLGMQVWAVMNDFDGEIRSSDDTMKTLSSDAAREKLVADTVAGVTAVGGDGINIDYENVSEECAPFYLQFLREMSTGCRNAGLVLSVSNYVPTYTAYLNRAEQARVVDYVVCLCYDEHQKGSPEAGSVASLPFVRDGIADTLKEVPAEQTIIAIPFFTRLWETTSQDAPDSSALSMRAASQWADENHLDVNWDKEAAQNYVEMQTDTIFYQMWKEDAASIGEKMKLISEAGCAGVAEWKLGFETPDIWDVIGGYLG